VFLFFKNRIISICCYQVLLAIVSLLEAKKQRSKEAK